MSNLVLRVAIIGARDLAAADRNGSSDPYAVVRINDKKFTTKVVKQTLDPVWDFDFDFPIKLGKVPNGVTITIWDSDTLGRDFLGEITLPFKNIFDRNAGGIADGVPRHFFDPDNKSCWFNLSKRSEKDVVSGDILVKFGFIEDHDRDSKEYVEAWSKLLL
ncbi:C2 domain-containing protein [Phycomyces blakesleeanus]|uniref:C2 domain-containing protein n=2 Tax=Phycomyces blakesleeanus TaxID=4837 RepID=A0A167N4U1_PHYB8|nr:hypothetical protein PHYBLDRAFT_186605 [Phycomyces blakesleeanus NRRL 1555(-)]OAD74994.1 hypothetical protein PHYBLDRAFT_186605 [Phycomyces blakesleeanus NRRL 1555(-)]|eukprot:XP_018293034.1 hypothetical protein PHYBLDRAFT_186605 [Phycomyces blakesleeanus NRRL 1555(-)]